MLYSYKTMAGKGKSKSKGSKGKKAVVYRSVPDKASCSEVRTLAPANANQIYAFTTFALSDFTRAAGIAQYYQRFRMVGVKVTWKPNFDTFALNAAAPGTGYQKANVYYIVDKTASLPNNITLEGLKAAGAKPHALDEKPIFARWRPAVLEENLAGGQGAGGFSGPSGFQLSPWLSTNQAANNPNVWNANDTSHQGIKFYIEQPGNGGAQAATQFLMEVECEFEFTKPMIGNLYGAGEAIGLQYAVIDRSPDGVEGGSDGITIPIPK